MVEFPVSDHVSLPFCPTCPLSAGFYRFFVLFNIYIQMQWFHGCQHHAISIASGSQSINYIFTEKAKQILQTIVSDKGVSYI